MVNDQKHRRGELQTIAHLQVIERLTDLLFVVINARHAARQRVDNDESRLKLFDLFVEPTLPLQAELWPRSEVGVIGNAMAFEL